MADLTSKDIARYRDTVGGKKFDATLEKLERQKAFLDDVESPFAKEVLVYLQHKISTGFDKLVEGGSDEDRIALRVHIDMADYLTQVNKDYKNKINEILSAVRRDQYYK
jgi:hypothetical protein